MKRLHFPLHYFPYFQLTLCVINLQYGDTPLHYAAFCGNAGLVRLLLSSGASPVAVGADGRTPLATAFDEGHKEVADMLMQAAQEGGSRAASALGDDKERDKSKKGKDGSANYVRQVMQLGDAAYAGDVRTVYSLLQAGADVNGSDPDGFTPLHRAATSGNLHVLELLLGHGADPNGKDLAGCTPLHYAAFCGNTDAAYMLLTSGSDANRRNRDGLTPVDVAKAENKQGVVRLLTGAWSKVENLDFGHGVVLEGELRAKRSGESWSAGLFRWKAKYAVLSRHYRALFLWTGNVSTVEGAVFRVRLDNIDAVVHDAKSVSSI